MDYQGESSVFKLVWCLWSVTSNVVILIEGWRRSLNKDVPQLPIFNTRAFIRLTSFKACYECYSVYSCAIAFIYLTCLLSKSMQCRRWSLFKDNDILKDFALELKH